MAFVLRVFGALLLRPWHDEFFTLWAAGLPLIKLFQALRWDSGPPLWYLLIKLLLFFGVPPLVAARGLSVLAGAVAVGLLARAAALFNRKAQGWVAWFLALHPLAVMWSAEARAYGLLVAFLAGSLVLLGHAMAGKERGWLSLAAVLAGALYTHALALLWLGALLAYALVERSRPLVWACASALASFAPWLPVMARQPVEAVAWMTAGAEQLPSWARLLGPWRLLPPVADWSLTLEAPQPPVLLQALVWVVVGWLLLHLGRTSLWWLFLLPSAFFWVASALGLPLFFPGRGEALLLPIFLLLLGRGLGGRRLLAAGLLLASLASSLWVLTFWHRRPPRPEALLAGKLIQEAPGGLLLTTGWWWLGLRFHLPASWELVPVPQAIGQHPGWFRPGRERLSQGELQTLERRLEEKQKQGFVAVLLTPGLPESRQLAGLVERLGLRLLARVPAGELYGGGR